MKDPSRQGPPGELWTPSCLLFRQQPGPPTLGAGSSQVSCDSRHSLRSPSRLLPLRAPLLDPAQLSCSEARLPSQSPSKAEITEIPPLPLTEANVRGLWVSDPGRSAQCQCWIGTQRRAGGCNTREVAAGSRAQQAGSTGLPGTLPCRFHAAPQRPLPAQPRAPLPSTQRAPGVRAPGAQKLSLPGLARANAKPNSPEARGFWRVLFFYPSSKGQDLLDLGTAFLVSL
ncbi:PREDICTED: uncharacterized protein LOC108513311 [Rhinopithecus bieti]|uniref:uncharacterized protein LOC108513311 n=1 Tax=Rhinopithecus bieti TaxID=61621 RepID=UPI00083BB47F|nr:PREDICTED: uncharacterized protein LOC108513311 [Rhinopithecus bieti]